MTTRVWARVEARLDELARDLAAADVMARAREARIATLTAALRALVERIEVTHRDPEYAAVWRLWQIHNGPYTGPQYAIQLKAALTALDAAGGA